MVCSFPSALCCAPSFPLDQRSERETEQKARSKEQGERGADPGWPQPAPSPGRQRVSAAAAGPLHPGAPRRERTVAKREEEREGGKGAGARESQVPEPRSGAARDGTRPTAGVRTGPRETLPGWEERGAWRAPQTCQRAGRSGDWSERRRAAFVSPASLCHLRSPARRSARLERGCAGRSAPIHPPPPSGPGPGSSSRLIVFVPRVTLGRERF